MTAIKMWPSPPLGLVPVLFASRIGAFIKRRKALRLASTPASGSVLFSFGRWVVGLGGGWWVVSAVGLNEVWCGGPEGS